MTVIFDQAVERARTLSAGDRELIGGLIQAFADDKNVSYHLTASQIEEVKHTQQEVRNGKISTDAEMNSLWKKFAV